MSLETLIAHVILLRSHCVFTFSCASFLYPFYVCELLESERVKKDYHHVHEASCFLLDFKYIFSILYRVFEQMEKDYVMQTDS